MNEDSETSRRDLWLKVMRRCAQFGESMMEKPDEEPPIVFNIFGHEEGVLNYFTWFTSREQSVDVLTYVGLVVIATNAFGAALCAKAGMTIYAEWPGETQAEFRDRALTDDRKSVPAIAAVVIYRGHDGARKIISQSKPIIVGDDGVVTFGKPEISDSSSPSFGGMAELLPENPPHRFLQKAAAAWLVEHGEAEMKRLGIHSL